MRDRSFVYRVTRTAFRLVRASHHAPL